jgi:hypothetical protein
MEGMAKMVTPITDYRLLITGLTANLASLKLWQKFCWIMLNMENYA